MAHSSDMVAKEDIVSNRIAAAYVARRSRSSGAGGCCEYHHIRRLGIATDIKNKMQTSTKPANQRSPGSGSEAMPNDAVTSTAAIIHAMANSHSFIILTPLLGEREAQHIRNRQALWIGHRTHPSPLQPPAPLARFQ